MTVPALDNVADYEAPLRFISTAVTPAVKNGTVQTTLGLLPRASD